jgi:hypothetical protein
VPFQDWRESRQILLTSSRTRQPNSVMLLDFLRFLDTGELIVAWRLCRRRTIAVVCDS